MKNHIKEIIAYIGEDPTRSGIEDTPERVIRSWEELYAGYKMNPSDYVTVFEPGTHNEMILLKNIEMYSTCEHHMLPFVGVAHIAYIPRDNVIGISKLARILECFSRKLQIQERIGEQIVDFLMTAIEPIGAACVIEAQHFCICSRGIGKQGSKMVTSSLRGCFLEDAQCRAEFHSMIKD